MKLFFALVLTFALCGPVFAQDSKVSDMTSTTTVDGNDEYLYIVEDISGTPLSRRVKPKDLIQQVTFANLPAAGTAYRLRWVTDCESATACSVGSGSNVILHYDDGTEWIPLFPATTTPTLDNSFDQTSGNIITGATEAKPLSLRGSGTGSDDGWDFYTDSSNVPQFRCIIADVNNACDYYRQLNDGKKWGVKDAAGNVELEHTEDSGITAMTVSAETSGVTITIPEKKWFPFAACQNATASLIWDSPTANAAAAACVTGTNTQKGVADFDATTDESLQIAYQLPSDFTGAIDGRIVWLAAATTGSVAWCVQLIKVSDGATDDPAFPAQATGNCVSDAAKGTTLQINQADLTSITCTSCAAGDLLHIRVSRDPDETSTRTDDMTGDARGIGLELTIRRAM